MMPNKGIVVPLFVLAHFLLTSLVIAQTTGALNLGFFTDASCSTRSTTNPNVTLGLSVCAATLGALSIFVPTFPCSGNNVRLIGYDDTGCRTTSGSYFPSDGCYEYLDGSFGSITLTCLPVGSENPISVVSYTTVSVGPFAADATGVASANPTSAFLPTGTASSGGSTSTGASSSGGTGNTSSNNGSSSSSSGWDAFPLGAKVGIIVGAIVAVAIIVILISWIVHRERRHRYERTAALQNPSNYPSGYMSVAQGQSAYQPSSYFPPSVPPSAQHPGSPPLAKPMYASSGFPVTEYNWNEENNRSQLGSQLAQSDIASWRDGTHTATAETQH